MEIEHPIEKTEHNGTPQTQKSAPRTNGITESAKKPNPEKSVYNQFMGLSNKLKTLLQERMALLRSETNQEAPNANSGLSKEKRLSNNSVQIYGTMIQMKQSHRTSQEVSIHRSPLTLQTGFRAPGTGQITQNRDFWIFQKFEPKTLKNHQLTFQGHRGGRKGH